MGAKPSKSIATGPIYGPEELSDFSDSEPRFHMFKDDVARIRYAKIGHAARAMDGGAPEGTLPVAFYTASKRFADRPAICAERPVPLASSPKSVPPSAPLAEWKTWTWKAYYEESRAVAMAFMKLGAVRYDSVVILGVNSPEWFMAEMGAILMGGKSAGLYPTDNKATIAYKTKLADGVIAVVDSASNFEKFASQIEELPYLKAIVTWNCERSDLTRQNGTRVEVLTWPSLVKLGETEGDEESLNETIKAIQPGNCACLVFTSGTTGLPKAAMISHDNLLYQCHVVLSGGFEGLGVSGDQERVLSYLPLSHVAGMMFDVIAPVVMSAFWPSFVTTYIARPYDLKMGSLGDRLRAVRPTVFLAVPRVYEKIEEKLKLATSQSTGLKKSVIDWAMGQALYSAKQNMVGGTGEQGTMYSVASKLLGQIHQALGLDQVKGLVVGGAPISRGTLEFFAQLDIHIMETYGMSETTAGGTWSTKACHLWGSAGFPFQGSEIVVLNTAETKSAPFEECPHAKDLMQPTEDEQGELCFRGRHVMMGYLANPKLGEAHVEEMRRQNEDTIDTRGYLHSGDKGSKNDQNMVRITGRYKDIIITAGGENVPPVPIEYAVKKKCPFISNVVMIGDQRKFNIALITLLAKGAAGEHAGTDELDGDAATFVDGVTKVSEAMHSQKFISAIQSAIAEVNVDGEVVPSRAARIQKFTILPHDLSIENEELTPSLKLRRSKTMEIYNDIINKVYASSKTYVPYDL